jgi:uncharacterized protein (TIGR03435 family)
MKYVLAPGLFFLLVLSPVARSQSPDRSGNGHRLSQQRSGPTQFSEDLHFEVASIRESGKDSGMSAEWTADTLVTRGQPVVGLILMAYFPMSLWSSDRIRNCNDPVCQKEYDVVAKIAAEDLHSLQGPEGQEMRRKMLQKLLADRFKLRLHTVAAEMPGFALVVNKKGARLTPTPKDEHFPERGLRLSHGGIVVRLRDEGDKVFAVYDASMASLVEFLAMGAHTVVEDHTGLKDRYDFVLSRNPDASPITHGGPRSPDEMWNLDLLGLHVDQVKASSTTLIIDHVERPSPN